ncbi:MAG: leucine--tRNA ligase [Phycisphaerales bacterium]|nr:leucine--tRNA ligase [Phycisphaerales bacterium]
MSTHHYAFQEIEPRWQATWEARQTFRAANPGEPGSERPKFYVLDFFPYPSGAGLHVGHPLGYIASDIMARFLRMRGYNVLHPMGWDAFGLPAEQYAVETGVHPRITTRKNIETYTRQLRMIGLAYDWSREIATCDPDYYRWTQWIFLKIYNSWYDPEWRWTDPHGRTVCGAARPIDKLPIPPDVKAQGEAAIATFRNEHRLAFLAEVPVNWCPALGTVLANEEVTNEGRSERGNHPVYRRPMKQWMLRITEYADRLLTDLDPLDWPEPIKLMQRNWIGRSQGAYVDFAIDGAGPAGGENIRVFTTRPDTLFGATYMVLAPEHRLVPIITTPEQREEVKTYCRAAQQKSELDRTADNRKKTGVFTGAYALNPVNRARLPIWVADYVLISYGTGSIMAVPGHDTRDLEFAETFHLPVVQVVQPLGAEDWRGFVGDGTNINSPPQDAESFTGQCTLNGLPTPEAKERIIAWLEERDLGEGTIQYKLRDWLFSRQRYWGEPFPILYRDDGQPFAVRAAELPVTLPEIDDFKPEASDDPNADPRTPLSKAEDWVQVQYDGETCRREVNTMPQWAGSCWYYLRFCDPQNDQALIDPHVERYWLGNRGPDGAPQFGGVDLYMGGAEHAVLHLLYARFWHKVLYDLGIVSTPEPFHKLFNQGMIQSYTFRDARGVCIPHEDVEHRGEQAIHRQTGEALTVTVEKMSKSLRNVVNPDAIIREYGADTLRLYEMYMGPLEKGKPWNTNDILGAHRFLQRVWRLIVPQPPDGQTPTTSLPPIHPHITAERNPVIERLLHKTIRKVTDDIPRFAYNTAIAQMMVFVNEASKATQLGRDQVERFLLLLAPFAPHITEELWERLGHTASLALADWPSYDVALTRDATVEIAVQVLGKVRARIEVPSEATEEQYIELARQAPPVVREIGTREVRRAIVVPGRLVNFIV